MRKGSNKVEIEMMIGLPGSGKTTKAIELTKGSYDTCLISVDEYRNYWEYRNHEQEDIVTMAVRRKAMNASITRFIIDGLFLTNDDIINNLISALTGLYSYLKNTKVYVKLHYWIEDRETCLKNDGGRREMNSSTTIKNAPYEIPNVERINEEVGLYVKNHGGEFNLIKNYIKHTVVLKPDYERFFKPYVVVEKDNKLRSEKWCAGGTSGNCWDSTLYPISADEPCEFTELDNLLESICPTITFLQYKKMLKRCVSTEETYESDYYGGGTNYLNWVCDLTKLYEMLKELGYIVSEE